MFSIETGDKNSILRTTCKKVIKFDEGLKSLVDEMTETMLKEDPETGIRGVGLAANQVGKSIRVMLVSFNVGTKKEQKIVPMINPELTSVSKEKVVMEEGCLSLPGKFDSVARPTKIKARWQNLQGDWLEKVLSKWDARIFLHELDHLNGKLFTDYQK